MREAVLALLLHIDWWGEIVPIIILCVAIFVFGVVAGRVDKKRGQRETAGGIALRAACASGEREARAARRPLSL